MASNKPNILSRAMLNGSFKDGYLDLMLSGLIILFGLVIFLSRTMVSDLISGIIALSLFLVFLFIVYRYHRSMQLQYVGLVKYNTTTKNYIHHYGWMGLIILLLYVIFSIVYVSLDTSSKYGLLFISEGFFLMLIFGLSFGLKQGRFMWFGLSYILVFQFALYIDLLFSPLIMPLILISFGIIYATFSLCIWWKTIHHRNERE